MSTFDINHSLLISFLMLFVTAAFKEELNYLELLLESFSERTEREWKLQAQTKLWIE